MFNSETESESEFESSVIRRKEGHFEKQFQHIRSSDQIEAKLNKKEVDWELLPNVQWYCDTEEGSHW